MRSRALILIAVLGLPSGLSGQGIRLPRPGQRTPTDPASPPPEIPVVARALAVKRARWSTEGYSLVSAVQVPTAAGGTTSYTTWGAGTHADYRFTDRSSGTIDLTASALGSPAITLTAETGARFSPLTLSEDYRGLRPFFDVRAVYMHMYDTFASPFTATTSLNGQALEGSRYSRGFGGVGGAGAELPITGSWALSTEVSAMRNRLTTYRLTTATSLPVGSSYTMTSFRLALGVKYRAVRSLNSTQK